MPEGHVVLEIGPNLLTLLLAVVSAVGAIVAAITTSRTHRTVKTINGRIEAAAAGQPVAPMAEPHVK